MRQKIVLIILTLVTTSAFAGAVNVDTNPVNKDAADLPVWERGDSWIYRVKIEGSADGTALFNVEFTDLKLEVIRVQGDEYILDVDVPYGKIKGYVEIEIPLPPPFDKIKGSLSKTKLDGTLYIQKSTIGFLTNERKMAFEGSGRGKVGLLPSLEADISAGTLVKEDEKYIPFIFAPLRFPLHLEDSWTIPEVCIIAKLLALGVEIRFFLVEPEHTLRCTAKKTVNVPAGNYEAFEITRDYSDDKFWYAPEARNIIKVDFSNLIMDVVGDGSATVSIEMELKSVNRAPDTPEKPSGPTEGKIRKTYKYESSTTDPDGDPLYYLFDWGDGTDSGWLGPYDSGDICKAFKKWRKKGTYSIRVKAKDINDAESEWSDPLVVSMPKDLKFWKDSILASISRSLSFLT
jgi:hypothetical protein